jgi:uncharacterized Zn-binding protein involved in type VI secretion
MKERTMRKAAARHGDSTTTRGFVIACSSTIYDDGLNVALSGDEATCGNCKGTYRIFGTGDGMSEKGRNVVVDGDLVLCPCGKNHVIVGSNPGIFLELSQATATSLAPSSSQSTAATLPEYDEQFRLVDPITRRPLANLHYRIVTASGRVITGTTDGKGHTRRIATGRSEPLSIQILARGR